MKFCNKYYIITGTYHLWIGIFHFGITNVICVIFTMPDLKYSTCGNSVPYTGSFRSRLQCQIQDPDLLVIPLFRPFLSAQVVDLVSQADIQNIGSLGGPPTTTVPAALNRVPRAFQIWGGGVLEILCCITQMGEKIIPLLCWKLCLPSPTGGDILFFDSFLVCVIPCKCENF